MAKLHSALKSLLVTAEHIREELIKAERVDKWETNEAPKSVIQV